MSVWIEDADKLEMSDRELDIVYANRIISSYLGKRSNYLGLSGIKGQGKTFLLKVKRKRLEEEQSVLCLPYNNMVDIIDSSLHIDKSLFRYLTDYNLWVNIWKFSICGAVLTCKCFKEEHYKKAPLKKITRKVLDIKNVRSEPSLLIERLLDMNINTLKQVLEDTGKMFSAVKNIHQSVCIFIDKLDQGFSEYAKNFNSDSSLPIRSRNASFWQYAQYALAESAYDICMNTSRHIKVYFSIRQEALIDAEILNKDKARNINSYIANLNYTKHDLREMYRLYIYNEEDYNLAKYEYKENKPSEAFIGIEEIPHGHVKGKSENIFDYIYRHTFKRPYDIMKICHELFLKGSNNRLLSIKEISDIVNDEAGNVLKYYLEELSLFLPCNVDEITDFIRKIPGNILNAEIMESICSTYHLENIGIDEWQCNNNCAGCSNLQPFSTLFNIGLIGYNKVSETDMTNGIAFESVGSSILNLDSYLLPESTFYYVHPALSNRAIKLRSNHTLPFYVNKVQVIGDDYEIDSNAYTSFENDVKESKAQLKKERIFVSSTIDDLENERELVRSILKSRGLNPMMSEHREFDTRTAQTIHSHDLCLNEVVKGKGFVFIIGEQYGGIYKGNNYVDDRNEIVRHSKGRIQKPSISLMEYYIARKNGLTCYLFLSKDIEKKRKIGVLSEDIKAEIDYINHFTDSKGTVTGNWMNIYDDIADLAGRLKRCAFD